MRKNILVKLTSCVIVLLLLCSLSVTAFAAEPIDFNKKGSVTVTIKENGKPVHGILSLYKIADLADYEGGYGYIWTGDFISCGLALDNLQSDELGEALAHFAVENNVKSLKAETDKNGTAVFNDVSTGVYLVTQCETAKGYNKIKPFLITVPIEENGEWVYNVDASPKVETEKTTLPSETTTAPTEEPELPFTGQLTWPIPVLALSGMILFVVGFMLYSSRRKKNEK